MPALPAPLRRRHKLCGGRSRGMPDPIEDCDVCRWSRPARLFPLPLCDRNVNERRLTERGNRPLNGEKWAVRPYLAPPAAIDHQPDACGPATPQNALFPPPRPRAFHVGFDAPIEEALGPRRLGASGQFPAPMH